MFEGDDLPLHGFDRNRVAIPLIDAMSDADVAELNNLLPWKCFVADSQGRRFGRPASENKRAEPNEIPDRRVTVLAEHLDLSDATVLEIGCFEGVHTVALARHARKISACDSRVVNLAKTAVRCAMFQVAPLLFQWDVEQPLPPGQDPSCDVLYHAGVLYHLVDPVGHLTMIAPHVRRGILLDTHYAMPEQAAGEYQARGRSYRHQEYAEGGRESPFSGMYPTARWLLLQDIVDLLAELGFSTIKFLERRVERNGPRMLLVAQRP